MLLPAFSLPPSDERLTTRNSGRLCRKLSVSPAVAVPSVSVAAVASAQRTFEIVIAVLPGVPEGSRHGDRNRLGVDVLPGTGCYSPLSDATSARLQGQPHRPGLIRSGSRGVLAASRNGLRDAEHARKVFRVEARLRSIVATCERCAESFQRLPSAFGVRIVARE